MFDTPDSGIHIKAARDALSEAVQWAARALPARPPVPILAGVKLSAHDGVLELSTFDREVSARSEIPVDIDQPGEVLVSGKLLADISKSLPNRDVSLSAASGHVVLSCGNASFNLSTMSLADYPHFPEMPALQGNVDATEFARSIQQVVIAASKDEAIPLLTGTKIVIDGNKIILLATDRYRLASRELEWNPLDPSMQAEILVKSKVLSDVAKSMTGSGDLDIHLSGQDSDARSSLIGFSAGTRQATSVLMDGDYPPVMKLFPEETPLTYTCNRAELLEAVRRVALVAERKTSVRLTFSEGALHLEAGQGELASANEAVEVHTESEDIRTAFNPQYLIEGLNVCDTDFVNFGFTDPKKAAVLQGQVSLDEAPDRAFRYLLMPIQYGV